MYFFSLTVSLDWVKRNRNFTNFSVIMNHPPGGILTKLDLDSDDRKRSLIDGEWATGVSVLNGDLLRLARLGGYVA